TYINYLAMLEVEFKYFRDHQIDLFKEYPNKYLVIKGEKVIGSFITFEDAIDFASKRYEIGTFMVQLCGPSADCYTQFHSRVIFA
ncbi:MAG: hypothetical protein M0Q12_02415, partial [Synergistaceae bacterium]|nr:hypothetical protein [Synergistaceae bacterium]